MSNPRSSHPAEGFRSRLCWCSLRRLYSREGRRSPTNKLSPSQFPDHLHFIPTKSKSSSIRVMSLPSRHSLLPLASSDSVAQASCTMESSHRVGGRLGWPFAQDDRLVLLSVAIFRSGELGVGEKDATSSSLAGKLERVGACPWLFRLWSGSWKPGSLYKTTCGIVEGSRRYQPH